jgi:hypothetical protein
MAQKNRRSPERIPKRPSEPISQRHAVWQVDSRPMPHWVMIAGKRLRPWIVLVTSRSDDLILAHDISEAQAPADRVWEVLAKAMKRPAAGEPHRPTVLQSRPHELWDELKPRLDDLGITLERTEELDHLDAAFRDMARQNDGDTIPSILEMPGMKNEHVASFYRAASKFYRRAPWRKLGDEAAIKVECGHFQSGPWYAVVMGQAGVTFGLTLYDDLRTLERMWEGNLSDDQGARATVALTVLFDGETGIPLADLDACRKFGWEVAGPAAYPWIFRKEPGMSVRPPLAWELELLEGCLHAVLSFVARHPPHDLSMHTMTVPVASGDLSLTLSWV